MRNGARRSKGSLIAALDVGSTKVCCFVARVQADGRPEVVGIGQQASLGVRAGALTDLESAETAILGATHAAEQMAGERIDEITVSLAGGKPRSLMVDVEVPVAGPEVSDGDLRRAVALGLEREGHQANGEEARELIHSLPTSYTIDGNRGISEPRGLFGERLGVALHFVTASAGAVRNLRHAVERCHLKVSGFVLAPYAAGLSSLVDDETELGVTLIDMGGGTTSIAVFVEGAPIFTDVVPVGGQHVTSDIARGLSTPLVQAERMKTLYGHALPSSADSHAFIEVPQIGEEGEAGVRQIQRSLLVGIIRPRLEETFELVRERLDRAGLAKGAGRRAVLVGGASQLPGVLEMAAQVLDKRTRQGRPISIDGLAEATSGPAYAAAAGLLSYAIEGAPDALEAFGMDPPSLRPGGVMGRLGFWLREHF